MVFFLVDDKEILTITNTYRFLRSWGDEVIKQTIVRRFGGLFFGDPLAPKGVQALPDKFYGNLLRQFGYGQLLCIEKERITAKIIMEK